MFQRGTGGTLGSKSRLQHTFRQDKCCLCSSLSPPLTSGLAGMECTMWRLRLQRSQHCTAYTRLQWRWRRHVFRRYLGCRACQCMHHCQCLKKTCLGGKWSMSQLRYLSSLVGRTSPEGTCFRCMKIQRPGRLACPKCHSGKGCTSACPTRHSCRGCRAYLCKQGHQPLKTYHQGSWCTLQLRGRWSLPGQTGLQNTSRLPWCKRSCQDCLRTSRAGKGCRLPEQQLRRRDCPCFLLGTRNRLHKRRRQPPKTTFREGSRHTSLCRSCMWRHAHRRFRRGRRSLGMMWHRTRTRTCLLGIVYMPPRQHLWHQTCRRSRAGTWCPGTSDHLRLPKCLPCSCCTWLQS